VITYLYTDISALALLFVVGAGRSRSASCNSSPRSGFRWAGRMVRKPTPVVDGTSYPGFLRHKSPPWNECGVRVGVRVQPSIQGAMRQSADGAPASLLSADGRSRREPPAVSPTRRLKIRRKYRTSPNRPPPRRGQMPARSTGKVRGPVDAQSMDVLRERLAERRSEDASQVVGTAGQRVGDAGRAQVWVAQSSATKVDARPASIGAASSRPSAIDGNRISAKRSCT
jgi:hypothetical protein